MLRSAFPRGSNFTVDPRHCSIWPVSAHLRLIWRGDRRHGSPIAQAFEVYMRRLDAVHCRGISTWPRTVQHRRCPKLRSKCSRSGWAVQSTSGFDTPRATSGFLLTVALSEACQRIVFIAGPTRAAIKTDLRSGFLDPQGQAKAAFRSRDIAAFKANAQCMEMAVREHGQGSVIATGADLVPTRNRDFVAHSPAFADALASAQGSRQIPGGLMVVFDGTIGNLPTPFFGLMKAELHEGIIRRPRSCSTARILRRRGSRHRSIAQSHVVSARDTRSSK